MSTMIKKAEATSKTHLNNIMQIAIFSLSDGRYYGINVSKIKSFEDYNKYKIIKNDTIKSKYLDGYIQHHKNVVPIINIEKWLEMYRPENVYYEYMVCEYNKHMVAFPICAINNIFNIPIEELQKPDVMFEDVITYNTVVEIGGQSTICLVLDVERLIMDTFGTEEIVRDEALLASDKEVLIAEDSKAARAVIDSIMESTQLKYRMFHDGKAIIDYLDGCSDAELENIGVIITDLEMPQRDGYQVLRHIQETKRLSDIPVIVNTSMSNEGVQKKVMELGAKSFIPKTDPENFLGEIRKNIRL
jgi:two-component system chemotaxis response regulator CheV